jgi:drug/metabolite transporter (DMT)-like permease
MDIVTFLGVFVLSIYLAGLIAQHRGRSVRNWAWVAAFIGPFALPLVRVATADILVLLYLGVFQIGLAYAALSRSVRHVPAFEASTLLLVEPALNPFWTWLVEGEQPGLLPVLGGVLVITAALVNARLRGQDRDAYQSPQ